MNLNLDWKFILDDLLSGHLIDLDESAFQTVHLPHDYSITQPYHREEGDGCTGYLVGGVAWYRKHISITEQDLTGVAMLTFDGIYNRANIYVNEHFVAFHPYGYSPCQLDISPYLRAGDNVIAVHVDHSRYADSRWYTGSGIYRSVDLTILPKTHIPLWGVKVESEVTAQRAKLHIKTQILGDHPVVLTSTIYDPNQKEVVQITNLVQDEQVKQDITIHHPQLWELGEGRQYTLKSTITADGQVTQTTLTKFGLREFHFDVDKGFYFNGVHTKIKGVCLHHDGGLVGAAVPISIWRHRLQTLMEGGVNAIRTAHNPASSEFLDLCDDMGLLVQEEFYDEWDNPKDKRYNGKESKVDYITRGHCEFFKDYAKQDLQAVVRRDWNHPCIFQWSIGNEIEWTYPKYNIATGYFSANASGNYFWDLPPYHVDEIRAHIAKLPRERYEIGDTAHKLAGWTRELDTTRPIIANCILPTASYESGYVDALDLVGFSYRQVVYERSHQNYPDKPIIGTENLAQWHEWKQVLDKEYISGIFLWTGVDYLGESGNTDVWPRKATASGLLDTAGFPKPSYHMFKSLWTETPTIYLATQTLQKSLYELSGGALVEKSQKSWERRLWVWQDVNEHWNYTADELVVAEVYSNCPSVTLYLNDTPLETKYLADCPDRIYKWCIPFAEGHLKAVGHTEQGELYTQLDTACDEIRVMLTANSTEPPIGRDQVCRIEAQLVDPYNRPVRHLDCEISFEILGHFGIFGVDNGSPDFVGDHFSHQIMTNAGRALLILGDMRDEVASITASLNQIKSNEILLQTK